MSKKMKRNFVIFSVIVMIFSMTTTAFATDDPIAVVNNLSEFIFGLIRAIGIILLAFGIVQVGLSLKSHDPSPTLQWIFDSCRRHHHHLCARNTESYYGLSNRRICAIFMRIIFCGR